VLGIGFGELLVVGILLLVFVGPERIPGVMRTAGRWYGQIRRMSDELRHAFVAEADRMDAEERYRLLRERRRKLEEDREQALRAAGEGTVAHGPPPSEPLAEVPPLTAADDPETPAPRRRSET
jgi:sec-independent protein translocase protein TatB